MENEKMYYEKKPISKPIDVKNAYEFVVANNIRYYRCISGKGDLYGWDGHTYVKAPAGTEWFENPNYIAPVESDVVDGEPETVADATAENVIQLEETEAETKSTSSETGKVHKTALDLLREKMAEKNAVIELVTNELNEAQTEIDNLKAENARLSSELSVKIEKCDKVMAENAEMAAKCAEFEEIVNSIELL